ncbi:alpha-D-ribose 1-methylphosphonate 5-triphosphate diphosphatase [Geitlerinema sp. PCC 9228]|jgi:alpha-D-ribose 1-methylphosphonate 5-triphosphate diphosphatase|uniref:alpha-D-ribose 1-methylphosphonate 5-triphosphate diphosphatase n=1 Tax=Geitlerinema sp. PCC 9228 TaxID=111611 RepID=UPI0008F9C92C|nr:alpha-D-ribose 1-methylphosphonate 5-triphosphate diphosphatase [Geitlerinema sp. PCC 9228]
MNEQIYTNYRLQLPDEEILGTLVVRDGAIADIQPGIVNQGKNGEGEILMPGSIELHTDNLEKCMSPRPGIEWPLEAAATYHDRDLIGAGITTVCDAIAIGDIKPGSRRLRDFAPAIDVIEKGQKEQKFAADHRLHLRCELSYESVCEVAEQYADNSLLTLISLMDHTPGQRQFVSIDKYKEYYMGKHGISAAEMEEFIRSRQQNQQRYAQQNRQALVNLTQQRGISLASHDDATADHVQEAVKDGAAIAEFPTTVEAAQTAHNRGLQVLLGAPNVVLGGSHSGNVAAMDLIAQGFGDILSSDYVPHSLLQSVFIVSEKTGKPLYETMRLVTSNPAKAIGLFGDRGSLEIGKRADLVCVRDDGNVPRLSAVIRSGKRVA